MVVYLQCPVTYQQLETHVDFVVIQPLWGVQNVFKKFPYLSFGEKLDYSGFDRDVWAQRSMEQHLQAINEVKSASTPTQVEQVTTKNGVDTVNLYVFLILTL